MSSQKTLIQLVGPRVRKLRLARRLSQKELAQRSGMDRSDLSRLETSRAPRNFGVERLEKIAKGLGIPVQKLFADC